MTHTTARSHRHRPLPTKAIASVALLLTLLIPAFAAAEASWRSAADQGAAARDARYGRGQSALDARRFDEAVEHFRSVADDGGADADAARYWQAWAEWKAGKGHDARRSLDRLSRDHESSPWLDDARALAAEIRAGRDDAGDDSHDHDDHVDISEDTVRIYALNSLMHTDSPRALDAVIRMLDRSEDAKLHGRILFVLSQSGMPKASAVLTEVARGTRSPGLQTEAIRYLGMSDDEANLALLQSIYEGTDQKAIKAAVLQAYLVSDAEPQLVAIATRDGDSEIRHRAIQTLGMIGASASLERFYREANDSETKYAVLQALGISNDGTLLLEVARTERDPKLRARAIQGLGIMNAGDDLRSLYAASSDLDTKRTIMNAFFVANEVATLIGIAKRASSAEERAAAVHWLSLMDDEEAVTFMLEILEGS